ncbi:MAG: GAF domain-containing protein [Chloroflexi bacterium]|nr:GAF domain-containing protein [Chloroflexota bacterium]
MGSAPALPLPLAITVFVLLLLLSTASMALAALARRRERESRTGALELERLGELSSRLAQVRLDPEELAEIAYEESARFLDTDFFQIGIFEGSTYRTLVWIRDYQRLDNQAFDLKEESLGIVGWVRDTARPLVVGDFAAERDSLPARPSYDSEDPPRSGLFVPLAIEGQALGIIIIQSRRARAFGQRDLHLLQVLASALTTSLALTSAQVEVRYRTLHLALLREISRQATALKPIRELLVGIVNLTAEALEGYRVRLYEKVDEILMLRASSDESEAPEAVQRALPEWLASSDGSPGGAPAKQSRQEDGALTIALRAEEHLLGTLELHHLAGEPMPAEHAELAETIGAQLALSMLEARNYAQQQEEAWVNTVLLEVARNAAQTGDSDVALQAVLRLATLLAGVAWAILLLPDSDGVLRLGPAAGLPRRFKSQHDDLRVTPDQVGASGPGADREAPYRTILPAHLAEHFDSQEAVALRLSDGKRLLGVLLIEGQPLTGRRPALLAGIAHQISLRLENAHLIEAAAARRTLERELSMARGIQESFLPQHPPTAEGWEVGTTWRLAREVGGDFYDFIPLEPGPNGPRWGIAIADVAGKGVPAALFMALSRTLLRSIAINRLDPGLTLTRLNDLIISDTQADMFVSVFYAVWEPGTGRISYANGGHNPPMVFEPGTRGRFLAEHEIVLGVQAGVEYHSRSLILPPGSLLVLYTDGVTEAPNDRGELFGAQRLEALILGAPDWNAQTLSGTIASRVSDFSSEPELRDDLTAVILRRLSP